MSSNELQTQQSGFSKQHNRPMERFCRSVGAVLLFLDCRLIAYIIAHRFSNNNSLKFKQCISRCTDLKRNRVRPSL